jgi:antagonist of KipI
MLLDLANCLAGAPSGAAAIEWALGSGAIRSDIPVRIAVVGPAALWLDDQPVTRCTLACTVPAGVTLSIVPGAHHRFSYLAIAGGIAVPEILGSRSTYLPGALGGQHGRCLRAGDRLEAGSDVRPHPEIEITPTGRSEAAEDDVTIRVTRGPQWARFDRHAREAFFAARFTVAPASDRMGYRLNGPLIRSMETATLPSEAACVGAVQIPDGGEPIVLMPDGPTVGGYAKLAVVLQADLRRLAQCGPGRGIRFQEVSLEAARACYSLFR